MKIITKRQVIQAIPAKWGEQYADQLDEPLMQGRSPKEEVIPRITFGDILRKLNALDLDTCGEDEIGNIIGNRSWTMVHCTSCARTNLDVAIQLDGPTGDGDEQLCFGCVAHAVRLMADFQR